MISDRFQIALSSLSDTKILAGCFASCAKAGLVIGLQGPLGAGKSECARAIITTLCDNIDDVPSPTFTLVQTYECASGLPIWHMDLYRLESAEGIFPLGVEEAFYEAFCLVEWPMRSGDYWPDNAVMVDIAIGEGEARTITITAPSHQLAELKSFCDEAGLSVI